MKSPELDDRDYEALLASLIRRIPTHSPQWTDHGPGDPGMALLELFAHLGTHLVDRINEVPARARQEFLRLLGLGLRPPQPARGMVRFSLRAGQVEATLVEAGPTLEKLRVSADDTPYEVRDEVQVLPVEIEPVVKVDSDVELDHVAGLGRVAAAFQTTWGLSILEEQGEDGTGSAGLTQVIAPYEVVPLDEPEEGAGAAVTDLAATSDGTLWIGVFAPEDLVDSVSDVREVLSESTINLAVGVDAEISGIDEYERRPLDPEDERLRGGAEVAWQVATGSYVDPEADDRINGLVFERLDVESDTTEGLTRSGIVRLRIPPHGRVGRWYFDDEPGHEDDPMALDADLRGVGPAPPAVDNPEDEARLITWIRVFRTGDLQPRLRWVDVNTARIVQCEPSSRRHLGIGDGTAHQVFDLGEQGIIPDSIEVTIRRHDGQWRKLERVDELLQSGPDELHYELDPVSGQIRFGDGVHGFVPGPGEVIRVPGMRHTEGEAGNVGAEAIDSLVNPRRDDEARLEVTNPRPTVGGQDAETPVEARERLPARLRHRQRAVAGSDFRDIAAETPGVSVGRVEVLPRFHPGQRRHEIPGVVTVLVLPAYDPVEPDTPTPDRRMLRRVCDHLQPRRLVTTELFVIGPEWVDVWVSVGVTVQSGFGVETVQRRVDLAVRQYLAPLSPYGPTGEGWPLGHPIRKADIQAAVLQVEGVRLVQEVELYVASNREIQAVASDQEVYLHEWELPVVRDVAVGRDNAPEVSPHGDPRSPAGEASYDPDELGQRVPVPVRIEEC